MNTSEQIVTKQAPNLSSISRASFLPANALIVRVPPRRTENLQAEGGMQYRYFVREAGRVTSQGICPLQELPRVANEIVLLLAAEDVLLTQAVVPPVAASRLREALPNLIEDRALNESSRLHVAQLSNAVVPGSQQTLAVLDRAWLGRVIERFQLAGHRVRYVLPESLCIPFTADEWTLACLPEMEGTTSLCLRNGADRAMALLSDVESASLLLQALIERTQSAPSVLKIYAASEQMSEAIKLVNALPQGLIATQMITADPIQQWLEGVHSQTSFAFHPQTLLQHEFARSLFDASQWRTWRRVVILIAALFMVQIIGMQIQWAQLRKERSELREQSSSLLKTAFPTTTTILDAPLQMERSLAGLRANAGQSDPGDFSALLSAAGQIFIGVPANSFRGIEYGADQARSLRIRLTPTAAAGSDQQANLVQRATASGYDLRFESAGSPGSPVPVTNPGEITAWLHPKGASR